MVNDTVLGWHVRFFFFCFFWFFFGIYISIFDMIINHLGLPKVEWICNLPMLGGRGWWCQAWWAPHNDQRAAERGAQTPPLYTISHSMPLGMPHHSLLTLTPQQLKNRNQQQWSKGSLPWMSGYVTSARRGNSFSYVYLLLAFFFFFPELGHRTRALGSIGFFAPVQCLRPQLENPPPKVCKTRQPATSPDRVRFSMPSHRLCSRCCACA